MSFIVKNSQLSNESLNSLNTLIEQDINAPAAFKLIRIIKFNKCHLLKIIEKYL